MAKVSSNKYVYFFDLLSHNEGRTYVGSTINLHKRFYEYRNTKSKRFASSAIKKYGFDSFYKLIIDLGDITYSEMILWEQFYIGLFGTYNKENKDGMNIVRNPNIAISKDPLVAKKISIARKGQKMAEATKIKLSNISKGKMHIGVKRPYLSERNKIVKPALGRVGEKHPMSKKVLYVPENKIFYSFQDCATYLCVSRPTIKNRINSNHKDYKLI
jgi:group I intron endonuclease